MQERLHDSAVTAPCGESRISGRCEAHQAFSMHDQAAKEEFTGIVQISMMVGPKHQRFCLAACSVSTITSDITLSNVLWCFSPAT